VEQLDHIFDRFYQAEGLAEHVHKGSGIGLALAKEVVTLHHGEIFVHSEKGKGSEFIICLPLGDSHLKPGEISDQPVKPHEHKAPRDILGISPAVEEEEEDVSETLETPGPAQKDIILIVEDNADVRAYIRGPLQSLYRVEEAKDGEEGIRKAQEIIPDLIISDILMPGIDGYELCRVLKNDLRTSHVPIVLLTAKASEESIVQGLETGADDYITKPFNTKILIARIKNLIDLRRQLQETFKREMTLQPVKMSVSEMDKEFLNDLQAVIDRNISDPEFSVEELCRKLYMGRTSLYRKIHALSGETPKEFIRSYRLKRAAELLKKKPGTVLEVSFEVGFSSSSYFAKCFKEKFHQLPSDYQTSD
jgi:DNA-binding response OmpR family regulator